MERWWAPVAIASAVSGLTIGVGMGFLGGVVRTPVQLLISEVPDLPVTLPSRLSPLGNGVLFRRNQLEGSVGGGADGKGKAWGQGEEEWAGTGTAAAKPPSVLQDEDVGPGWSTNQPAYIDALDRPEPAVSRGDNSLTASAPVTAPAKPNASVAVSGTATAGSSSPRQKVEMPLPRRSLAHPAWLCMNGRQAPTVFVLGCQKCGTTSLVAQMEEALRGERGERVNTGHAFTYEPAYFDKEKHFFSEDSLYAKGPRYYLNQFPRCSLPKAAVCDATPNYLNHPEVPRRLRQLYGEASANLTFLVILRDPADGWLHQPWEGEPRPAEADYKRWVQRSLRQERECAARGVTRPWPDCDVWGLFVSFYAEQLRNWLRHFDPSQFVVVPLAQYLGSNRRVMADVAVSLGLQLGPGRTAPPMANTRKVRKKTIDRTVTSALRSFFQPYNDDLIQLLDTERKRGLHVSPEGRVPVSSEVFFLKRGRHRAHVP